MVNNIFQCFVADGLKIIEKAILNEILSNFKLEIVEFWFISRTDDYYCKKIAYS